MFMNPELELIAAQLNKAQTPEDVFGTIQGPDENRLPAIKKSYHALVKVVHPDLYPGDDDKMLAQAAFGQLTEWFRLAEERVKLGVYGQADRPAQVMLQTRRRTYCIDDDPAQDDVFTSYPCRFDDDGRLHLATIKIARDPHYNEFAQNEIQALRRLQTSSDARKFEAYIPNLIDAFIYQDEGGEHQASVFDRYPGWHSFEDVRRVYPRGVDPKDMAWMFRRLLVALGFAHRNGVAHGAVWPRNVWILPEEHGLMLTGWVSAVCDPADLTGAARSDIGMAVKCMLFLLGGDPQHGLSPETLPNPLKAFFKGSLLPGKRAPQDAWALKDEFDELIERLWGKRAFRPFVM